MYPVKIKSSINGFTVSFVRLNVAIQYKFLHSVRCNHLIEPNLALAQSNICSLRS